MFLQIVRQVIGWSQSVWTAFECTVTDKYFSAKEGPCSKNDSLRFIPGMGSCFYAAYFSFFHDQICYFHLPHGKMLCMLDGLFHFQMVSVLVSLCPE